ncbi:MAG: GH3 family domain-containing protein [Alcanivoracaceae bacterium]
MNLAQRGGHWLLRLAVAGRARRFAQQASNLEKVQRQKLKTLLESHHRVADRVGRIDSWEAFQRRLPVTDFDHWRADIGHWRDQGRALVDSPLMRFQPTSGSTSAIKWIPYTRAFLDELDSAIAPWLSDLYRQFPDLGRGTHYWSMSWLPTDMRAQQGADFNDDLKLLSFGKRLLAGLTQSVPDAVSMAPTSEAASFATLAYLVADRRLAMLSVWSPTFALTQHDQLRAWRQELAAVLGSGDWGARREQLGFLPCPRQPRQAQLLQEWDGDNLAGLLARLWPRMALVSAWDTAAAAPWAEKLGNRFANAGFQGKGLWATEGVVTIPWQGRHVLAYQSHVYEFENLDDGTIVAPWALRDGMQVAPLISTGSGLLRYRMGDCLEVGPSCHGVPSLRFLGREDGVDLVGEKMSTAVAQQLLEVMGNAGNGVPVSLVAMERADQGRRPGYVLLLEKQGLSNAEQRRMQAQAEDVLSAHFHYRVARDLGQLAPVSLCASADMREFYLHECRRRGMIEGNIKVEPLSFWRGDVALPGDAAPSPVAEAMM